MKLHSFINNLLRHLGVQIKRYPDKDIARRLKIIKNLGVTLIFDVGANTGQFAKEMRRLGYRGRLVSFEPLQAAYQVLAKAASKDPDWKANHFALGDQNGRIQINVAGNSFSSSILNMLPAHEKSAPGSSYVTTEEIEISSMDSVFQSFFRPGDSVMLKIDTQGYERQVLNGAKDSLKYVTIIQLEMSMVPLYENEMLFMDMVKYLEILGYSLYSLENGFSDDFTGQLLQVDGIFARRY